MGLLRLVVVVACLVSSATAFAPPSAGLRSAVVQQRTGSVTMMPKAATKPMRVNARNREYNKKYRSEMRTRIKRVRSARTPSIVLGGSGLGGRRLSAEH